MAWCLILFDIITLRYKPVKSIRENFFQHSVQPALFPLRFQCKIDDCLQVPHWVCWYPPYKPTHQVLPRHPQLNKGPNSGEGASKLRMLPKEERLISAMVTGGMLKERGRGMRMQDATREVPMLPNSEEGVSLWINLNLSVPTNIWNVRGINFQEQNLIYVVHL